MPRRVSLPGASELFRPTGTDSDASGSGVSDPEPAADAAGQDTGRVRHEAKITVYVSVEELVALEQARLTLRARHRLAVDRGRIVRAAVAAALDDLEAHGESSDLFRRLSPS